MPQDRGYRRKHSRSLSPVPSKHKRSWQNPSGERFGAGGWHLHRHRSPSPVRSGKKSFRPPAKLSDRRKHSPVALRKSRSPHSHKRNRSGSPPAGRGATPSYERHSQVPHLAEGRDKPGLVAHHNNERSESKVKQRSNSLRPEQNVQEDRNKRDVRARQHTPPPEPGPSVKKRPRPSEASLGALPKRSRSRSRSRDRSLHSSSQPKNDSSVLNSGNSIPQRRVSNTVNKKKPSRLTLHKRFTVDDQDTFELEENVTIAILRKPDAQPSEDVTVKKIFDASQFKMIHKKTEGRKPIFDREEIKIWRHDENLADDPDYERRLVRVKSTSGTSKSTPDSLSRMSPGVIRKAIGQQTGGRSDRSHMEQQIRLDPRPDPRYESKFRQQIDKEEEVGRMKRRNAEKRRGFGDRRESSDSRGGNRDVRDRRWEEERREKEETYDLRQALERRRSGREEGSFSIEVRRESNPEADFFYRDGQQTASSGMDHRQVVQDSAVGRNVVLNQGRRFGGRVDRDGGRSWNGRRFGDGRGYLGRGRGRRRDWSLEKGELDGGMRGEGMMDFRGDGRNFERQQRYSSPPNTRGWRGGYRGRGRGRARDFAPMSYDHVSPSDINDSFKYSQHDDRDVSPKSYRGRGGRARFTPRNFGGSSFQAMSRGGSRGGGRSFGGGYRGRGFVPQTDRRSLDRVRDVSVDREWKHDMYDSLQAEVEQPHNTTTGT